MNIPGIDTCISLMDEYGMLPNIRRHSVLVARIAELISSRLSNNIGINQAPDHALCINGALLHDIAKTPCLEKGCDHAATGGKICQQHGYPEIAEIVAGHVILQDFSPERYQQGHFLAQEIVYYADKRVRHDSIVSLAERLEYIIENYGKNDTRTQGLINENFSKCRQLEGDLFSYLNFSPELLLQNVEQAGECSSLAALFQEAPKEAQSKSYT